MGDWDDVIYFNPNTNSKDCPFISVNPDSGSIVISSSFWKLLTHEYGNISLYYKLGYSKSNNALLIHIKVAQGFDCKKLRSNISIRSFTKQLKIDCPKGRFVPKQDVINGEDCWVVYFNSVMRQLV